MDESGGRESYKKNIDEKRKPEMIAEKSGSFNKKQLMFSSMAKQLCYYTTKSAPMHKSPLKQSPTPNDSSHRVMRSSPVS